MNLIAWAMSSAEWTCAVPGCGQKVHWVDAFVIETPEVIAVLHKEHVNA